MPTLLFARKYATPHFFELHAAAMLAAVIAITFSCRLIIYAGDVAAISYSFADTITV